MFEFDGSKVLFVVTALALIGTSSLFLITASQEPPEVRVGEIDCQYLDTVVNTEGYVMDIRNFYGTFHVTIREPDDEHQMVVLIEGEMMDQVEHKEMIVPGAVVSFEGRVEEYGNRYRIRIASHSDVNVIEEARSSFTTIEAILENPWWYEGTDVKIRGEVKDLWTISRGTHMIICPLDNPYRRLTCEVDDWWVDGDVVRGDLVVIEGVFEYSQWKGMWMVRSQGRPEVH